MLMFGERTKQKTSRSRVENQQTQPTYYVEYGKRIWTTLVEGECFHRCDNKTNACINNEILNVCYVKMIPVYELAGGAVASRLECSTPDRVVRLGVLAGDIVFCSWARHFTLKVPLSTQLYKCVPAKRWG